MTRFTDDEISQLGLTLVGFSDARQAKTRASHNDDRFRGFYGIGARAVNAMVEDLFDICEKDVKNLKKIFMTLHWLKTYSTEIQMSGYWKCDEQTVRTWVWGFAKKIQSLKETKIEIQDILEDDSIFALTVDGVHCRTYECRKMPSAKWYSHKHSGPGLTYELGIAIHANRLVWMNGSFMASTHDLTMFRDEDGLKSKLRAAPKRKKVLGDSAYSAEGKYVSTKNTLDDKEVAKFKSRAMARHETFNRRIKFYSILANTFRHDFRKHVIVFEAICVLAQYDMENGNPLFEV